MSTQAPLEGTPRIPSLFTTCSNKAKGKAKQHSEHGQLLSLLSLLETYGKGLGLSHGSLTLVGSLLSLSSSWGRAPTRPLETTRCTGWPPTDTWPCLPRPSTWPLT